MIGLKRKHILHRTNLELSGVLIGLSGVIPNNRPIQVKVNLESFLKKYNDGHSIER